MAIYFQHEELTELLLTSSEFYGKVDPMAIKQPPDNNQHYHIMTNELSDIFAFSLAISNRNDKLLLFLTETFAQSLTCRDICSIISEIVGEFLDDSEEEGAWTQGMQILLMSSTFKLMYTHLRPTEKEAVVSTCLVDALLSIDARVSKEKEKRE